MLPVTLLRIVVVGALVLPACGAPAGPAEAPKAATPAKIEPPTVAPQPVTLPAPIASEPVKTDPPAAAEPLTFTLGTRSFPAVVALASRYNDQRRIIISSQPFTCEELLAIPEVAKKGRVSFIVTAAWKSGSQPLTAAEVLDDDTRKVERLAFEGGTIELVAGPDRAGERGKLTLNVRGQAGGAQGAVDVELCE
jgi:hypothetical protein